MILQNIVFIIVATLIITQGKPPEDIKNNGDHKEKHMKFPPEMTKKELMDYCYSESPCVRLKHIPRTETVTIDTFKDSTNSKNRVRVLQWNILSEILALYSDGFTSSPTGSLVWDYRRCVILDELLMYEADIMCLQEVDHYDFFSRALATQSYDGIFLPKTRTPCVGIKGNNGPDGCAIFYNKTKYVLEEKYERNYYHLQKDSRQVALLVILRDRISGNKLCVATTHLKSRIGTMEASLRKKQGEDLLKFVYEHAKRCPTIITGDFNAAPTEPVYKTMRETYKFMLDSAYNIHGEEPVYTSWKIREKGGEQKSTLDYIFYTKNYLTVGSIIAMPKEESIGKNRVPSYAYPSDHFSLIADFFFNEEDIIIDLIQELFYYIDSLKTFIKEIFTTSPTPVIEKPAAIQKK